MTKNQKMHEILTFLEKEMIGKRGQSSPPQTLVCEVETPWISRHPAHDGFHLGKEPVTQLAASLRIVKRQRRPQIALNPMVEDHTHRSPSKLPADFLPRATLRRIIRKLPGASACLGDPVVLIHQHGRQRTQQFSRQPGPITIRQVHHALLKFLKLHT